MVVLQIKACAAFCNLLLEIRQAKTLCIEKCLGLLVSLTQSSEPQLVCHAAWSFKNLTDKLPNECRFQVLKEFHWTHVKPLINHPDSSVQHSALRFVQNVCSSDPESIQSVIDWSQGELLGIISEKLTNIQTCRPDVVTASLTVISNIATGTSEHQAAVIASGIPSQLLTCLRDKREDSIRCAATFCVINLIWRDELPLANGGGEEARQRAMALREIGIEAQLKSMQGDASLDVRERVRTAIGFFSG